jgi:hypothetical protein
VTQSTQPSKPLKIIVGIFMWLPLVAVAIAAGFAFGWVVPVAVGVYTGALMVVLPRLANRNVGRFRTTLELIAFALLGSVLGGILFDGLGVILGFVLGFLLRLSSIPITARRRR